MLIFTPLTAIATALACIGALPTAQADFHIGRWGAGNFPANAICPSNYWNCACFQGGVGSRRYDVSPRSENLWDNASGYWNARDQANRMW
ncbi:hypothetical protein S7711_11596 [Stachybotrys chartarum IBT 7711]|uniref:Uncharacterized protein n=1 Tax=Stachybotrys chartarum (strain CBS 109288 / IBT 7711) TaxID=1280523 RepID=A0A084AF48_STACB|nr:hypothetical protein S7711_11596 [Stachybotrys chartarum IBT 7711]